MLSMEALIASQTDHASIGVLLEVPDFVKQLSSSSCIFWSVLSHRLQ